jgi:hypothetical protein
MSIGIIHDIGLAIGKALRKVLNGGTPGYVG